MNRSAQGYIRILMLAFVVTAVFGLFELFVGTHDVEESTKITYSAGIVSSRGGASGVRTLLGIPVFDTLQGTGDRLPYQASWGQSVTWPLRMVGSWEVYVLLRSVVFSSAAVALALLTIRSWSPNTRFLTLAMAGLLMNSSFGLYLLQNEWSDTYVQTISVVGTVMFLLNRRFFAGAANCETPQSQPPLPLLFLCLNGIVTGHPGLFSMAFVVVASFFLSLMSSIQYRQSLLNWARERVLGVVGALISVLVTVVSVIIDLSNEKSGLIWDESRRMTTQGFIGTQVFRGFSRGLLPDFIEQYLSVIAVTALTPIARLTYPFVDQFDVTQRLGDSFPRGEFSASLIIVAAILGYKWSANLLFKSLLLRFVFAQVVVLVFTVVAHEQAIPSTLIASGVWIFFPVLLSLNVAFAFLLLSNLKRRAYMSRILGVSSLVLATLWLVMQLGFGGVGGKFKIPVRTIHWTHEVSGIESAAAFREKLMSRDRVLFVDDRMIGDQELPRWQNFLKLTALGVPVIAPADPKMRSNPQLVQSFGAYNTSLGYIGKSGIGVTNPAQPRFDFSSGLNPPDLNRLLDFLQVRYVLIDSALETRDIRSLVKKQGWNLWTSGDSESLLKLENGVFQIYERAQYSAFLIERDSVADVDVCPVLERDCFVISESTHSKWMERPPLRLCETRECLWKLTMPKVLPSQFLILPIGYDPILRVRSRDGVEFGTTDVGGFVAVGYSPTLAGTEVLVELSPDGRIISRVVASYVNLLVFVSMLVTAIHSSTTARRRRLRIK